MCPDQIYFKENQEQNFEINTLNLWYTDFLILSKFLAVLSIFNANQNS